LKIDVSMIGDCIMAAFGWVWGFFTDPSQTPSLPRMAIDAKDAIWDFIKALPGNIMDGLGILWECIKRVPGIVWGFFTETVPGWLKSAGDAIWGFISNINFGALGTMIGDAIGGLWNKIKQVVQDIPGKIVSFTLGLVGLNKNFGQIQGSRAPLPVMPGVGEFVDEEDEVVRGEPLEFEEIEAIERGSDRRTASDRALGAAAGRKYGRAAESVQTTKYSSSLDAAKARLDRAGALRSAQRERYAGFYDHFGRSSMSGGAGRTNISNKSFNVTINSNLSVSEILEDLDRMTTMDDASFFNSVM